MEQSDELMPLSGESTAFIEPHVVPLGLGGTSIRQPQPTRRPCPPPKASRAAAAAAGNHRTPSADAGSGVIVVIVVACEHLEPTQVAAPDASASPMRRSESIVALGERCGQRTDVDEAIVFVAEESIVTTCYACESLVGFVGLCHSICRVFVAGKSC